jgi:hypothetical protein
MSHVNYFSRILNGQQNSLKLLQAILNTERLLTYEVEQYSRLNCFPSQELTMIRKEIRQFKDLQSNLISQVEGSNEVLRSEKGVSTVDNFHSISEDYSQLISVLSEEQKLSDRKLTILNHRRLSEEEARLAYYRKIQKTKALEEIQSKDPLNFRNQTRRF